MARIGPRALALILAIVAGLGGGVRLAAVADTVHVLPVPAMTMYPGDTVTEASLVDRAFAVNGPGLGQMAADRASIVGSIARRTLLAGHAIPRDAIRPPYLVTRGQVVAVVFQSAGLTITGSALALQSAAAGEQITARNDETGRVLSGRLLPDRTIRVGDK